MRHILSLLFAFVLLALPMAAKAYTIQPGDLLQIEVVEDSSLNRTVLVLPDGSVNFPGAGTIRAAGSSVNGFRDRLSSLLASDFASVPTVYVSVTQTAPREIVPDEPEVPDLVYLMGEINSPGAMPVEEDITLLQAIAQAGGFTRFAATRRVELHRMDPSTQTEEVFLFDYQNRQGISGATRLNPGDVIVVPERRLFER